MSSPSLNRVSDAGREIDHEKDTNASLVINPDTWSKRPITDSALIRGKRDTGSARRRVIRELPLASGDTLARVLGDFALLEPCGEGNPCPELAVEARVLRAREVKGGHLKATDVRDLRCVIEREEAEIGVRVSLEAPTRQMRAEAASAGALVRSFAYLKVV